VIDKIKEHILTPDNLTRLVCLVNEEMDHSARSCKDEIEVVADEILDINSRLERLYDALETGKIRLGDLSPRIHELRCRQEKLQTRKMQLESFLSDRRVELADPESALKAWRHTIESTGVFTFKDSLKDRFISGFCLLHEQFPIIFLNNSNSFTRQIFTLIHELGHILYQIHGITDIDEKYIEYLDTNDREIEIRCNEFAAEFLVPINDFQKEIPLIEDVGLDIIPELAEKYSVSREVILRRLLDYGCISKEYYSTKSSEWNTDYLRAGYKEKGGDWYLIKLAYLGEGFTRLVLDSYHQGRLSKEELGYHFNMNAKNIDALETYLGR